MFPLGIVLYRNAPRLQVRSYDGNIESPGTMIDILRIALTQPILAHTVGVPCRLSFGVDEKGEGCILRNIRSILPLKPELSATDLKGARILVSASAERRDSLPSS